MKTLMTCVACAFLTFTLAAASTHAQTFSVVYNFGSQANDPFQPVSSGIIAQGRDGNLYSSAFYGGVYDYGATYKLTPAGVLSLLNSFQDNADGADPDSGLTLGSDGNLYGTTGGGGVGYGTIFKNTPTGAFTLLYTFTDAADGATPMAPPIQGTDRNFYGTAEYSSSGYGSIYKITPSGSFSVLYECDSIHCQQPVAPLIEGTDGNFYGTSQYGGTSDGGTIFKITPAGKLTVLYNFDSMHGATPVGPLVQGTDGNFYGTTELGGQYDDGVVFKITPAGHLTVLHSMKSNTDGSDPEAGLVQATDGNLYGANATGGAKTGTCATPCGTLFKITTSGTFTVIHNFAYTDGDAPFTTLMQHTNGILYGTTNEGGSGTEAGCHVGQCGVVYSVNIDAAPFVALVTPAGRVGAKIGILGQNFSKSSVVTFGSTPATQVALGGTTFLLATVPTGATTGFVTVTTAGGTLTSNKEFRVIP